MLEIRQDVDLFLYLLYLADVSEITSINLFDGYEITCTPHLHTWSGAGRLTDTLEWKPMLSDPSVMA